MIRRSIVGLLLTITLLPSAAQADPNPSCEEAGLVGVVLLLWMAWPVYVPVAALLILWAVGARFAQRQQMAPLPLQRILGALNVVTGVVLGCLGILGAVVCNSPLILAGHALLAWGALHALLGGCLWRWAERPGFVRPWPSWSEFLRRAEEEHLRREAEQAPPPTVPDEER